MAIQYGYAYISFKLEGLIILIDDKLLHVDRDSAKRSHLKVVLQLLMLRLITG